MTNFQKGDKIQHATWGDGVVTGNDGEFVRVRYERFEDGQRVLGVYDAAWFEAHPTGLLHRASAGCQMTDTPTWRCFHCHQVFTDFHAAEAHFGRRTTEPPECYPYLAMVREARECRWFTQQIINGIDTGLLTFGTQAEETFANILSRGRAALLSK